MRERLKKKRLHKITDIHKNMLCCFSTSDLCARGFPKTRRQFLFLCHTERATRSTSFSCRGHMPEGMGPLTRESSARAVGFMNTKMPLHNADQTLFLYPILNYESLLVVCWIPASGGDAACAGMTIFAWSFSIMPPTEVCSEFLEIPLHENDMFRVAVLVWHENRNG